MDNLILYLRFLLALATILAMVGRADAATTVRVGSSSATAFDFMPLALGIEQRSFAKNGIDAQQINLGGSAQIVQAMVAGSIDVSLGAGTDVPFIMKGVQETGIGAIAITPALLGVIVGWNSPIHSLADLKSKKIGVSSEGSLTQWVAIEAAAKAGVPRKDLTFIYNGSSTAADIAALVTGQEDAQVSAVALGWNLEEQRKGRLLAPASDFVGPFLLNVLWARNDFIKEHPEAVRGFLKGWYATVNFMATHRADTIQFAKTVNHFSDTVNEKQYDAVMPSMSRDGTFPAEALAATARSMIDLQMLPSEPDMTKFMTTRFLPPHRDWFARLVTGWISSRAAMSAYIVADLDIHDAAAWDRYVEAVVPVIAKYGGHSIIRRGAIKVLEGDAPKHFVVVQFDTMEAAQRFYDAPEYAAPRQLRLKAATGPVFIVEGALGT